ncbi:CX3C chemokine receptor 1-like [Eublepharis macularius]|uniref:CX3C chemokine receptor 1-like n=1 Tax=Eublepharis macularius TaxID=481883 RepID=A0AA97K0V2_EUBMA|nr:CX3C chemokine receptor 1-like [Eublepharis macularius]XP_054847769.1 CX3C chemokine receptor 1-like [Eublepharis macularius]XP_054847770.1 CX3C chemokine receptor 1-like [Eublepharis macularius]
MAKEMIEMTTVFAYDESAIACDQVDIYMLGKTYVPLLYGLVFMIGLAGNLLVVFIIVKGGQQKSITDIFLLNLAISDLLFVISLPFWGYYVVHGWTLGNLSCRIVSSFYSIGFFGGMFFITIISIDRYLAIVHATIFMKARTTRQGFLTSLVVWVLAILCAAPQFVFIQKAGSRCVSQYPEYLEDTWPVFCNFEINIIGFLLPMCIMSICYFRILRTLFTCKNRRKRKAVRLILQVVLVFFLFWTPHQVLVLLQTLKLYNVFESCNVLRLLYYTMFVTETLAFSHCCLNPIIYAFAGEKFKKYLSYLVLKSLSFICFCGPCGHYHGRAPASLTETVPTSNQTQNTSDQDGSVLL